MKKIFNKTLIIGFKKGLGNELLKAFKTYSKSITGLDQDEWDISDKNAEIFFEKYIKSFSYDLIILNAHIGFNALSLLNKICKFYKSGLTLIVIGSIVTDQTRKKYYEYYLEKSILEQAVRQLQFEYENIDISLFKPGWIDTDFIKKINGIKMSPDKVSKYILDLTLISKKYNFQLIGNSFIGKK